MYFSSSYSKKLEDDSGTVMLHYFHINIYSNNKKLIKLMQNNQEIDLIHSDELKERDFKPDAVYTVVHLINEPIQAFYD